MSCAVHHHVMINSLGAQLRKGPGLPRHSQRAMTCAYSDSTVVTAERILLAVAHKEHSSAKRKQHYSHEIESTVVEDTIETEKRSIREPIVSVPKCPSTRPDVRFGVARH